MKLLWHFRLTLFCVLAIWYLCVVKPPSLRIGEIVGFDKIVHAVMYLGLCTVFWWEYISHGKVYTKCCLAFWGIILPILMSGMVELVQEYCTETRTGDWADFAANSVGVLLAFLLKLSTKQILSSSKSFLH